MLFLRFIFGLYILLMASAYGIESGKIRSNRTLINSDDEIYQQLLPGENVQVFACTEAETWQMASLLRRCAAEVDALTGLRSTPKIRLQFLLPEETPEEARRPFNPKEYASDEVPLHSSSPLDTQTYEILRALLWRRACESAGVTKRLTPLYAPAVNFIAAGLCNRLVYDGKGGNGIYMHDYRIPRSQMEAGHFPQIEKLLENALEPSHHLLFRLYAVHCDLLLQCLESHGGLQRMIGSYWKEMVVDHQPAPAALLTALALPSGSTLTLQSWYEINARANSLRGRQSYDREAIARQLREEILVIPVLTIGNADGMRNIPLEEIPAQIKQYKLDLRALTAMQQRLMQFRYSAPPMLRPALDTFNGAIELLRKGDDRGFNERVAQGRRAFAEAMAHQQRAEELLDAAEALPFRSSSTGYIPKWLVVLEELEQWPDYGPVTE